MVLKILIGVLLTAVILLGFGLPMVPHPTSLLEFPVIPGLEEKARIIFFHVPTAWLSVMAFLTSMWFAIQYLRTKDRMNDEKSAAAAGLGFLFTVLATITGAVWAKFNWGSYWNWDPRETSIFVLLLIYGAYFSLRSAIEVEEKRATLSSVYSIIAAVTVPFFVFIMPRIMTGLHPGAKGDPAGAGPVVEFKMDPGMRMVFFMSLFAFTLLFIWMFRLRIRIAHLESHDQRED
jgi:heme exporter protein C